MLQLVQLMVAARYLDADAFGALAIVNITIWVALGFQDMGLSSYCVHLGEVPRRTHSTLFWISTALGGLGGAIVALCSGLIATFYDIPTLQALLSLLALNFLLIGLSAQYQANLIRTFQARLLAQIEIVARVISLLVTVLLLVRAGLGPEAIVIGLISFSLTKLVLLTGFADTSWHPRMEFDCELAPRAITYGAYQAGSQVINQLRSQADQLILGKMLGSEMLGIYSLAKELISYPQRVVLPLIARLTLPVLARKQADPAAMRDSYLGASRKTAIFSGLVYSLLAVFSPWAVELLYGDKFLGVATLVPLMAVFGALRPLGMSTGMLAQATGRTRNEFSWNLWSSVLILAPTLAISFIAPTVETYALNLSVMQVVVTLAAYPLFIKPLEPIGMARYCKTWALPFASTLAVVTMAHFIHIPSISSMMRVFDEIIASPGLLASALPVVAILTTGVFCA